MAHRWIWAEANGKDPWEVPGWLRIKQSCGNHWCVNPEHLVTEVSDTIIAALPDLQVVTEAEREAFTFKSPDAVEHSLKTYCLKGHAFRTEPVENCVSCRIQNRRDITYGIKQVPSII